MAAQMLGTIDYVAPEQIEGNEADTPGDVYGLACVLFETLVGTAPFAAETGGMAKMWAHINAEPPSAREHRPEVSPALDDLIRRGLAKSPGDRPTAAAFGVAVMDAADQPA
jgi:serine/threonine-protein kinase